MISKKYKIKRKTLKEIKIFKEINKIRIKKQKIKKIRIKQYKIIKLMNKKDKIKNQV